MSHLSVASPGELRLLAESMAGQEHAGALGSLLLRAARYLGGDPAGPISVANASTTAGAGLPDNTTAESALLQVLGGTAVIRADGQAPLIASDLAVVQGSYLVLTGKPTMRALQFVSLTGAVVTLTGLYFT